MNQGHTEEIFHDVKLKKFQCYPGQHLMNLLVFNKSVLNVSIFMEG